jgi:hypothetical protein
VVDSAVDDRAVVDSVPRAVGATSVGKAVRRRWSWHSCCLWSWGS